MSFHRTLSCALGVVIILTMSGVHSALGQSPLTSTPEKRHMVVLTVRVTKNESHAVLDIDPKRFRVTENGAPQSIEFSSKEELPLTYGLVIDTSGSLRTQIRSLSDASIRILSSQKPSDEAFIARFISNDKIETIQDFTNDQSALINSIQGLYVEGGQTALVDAVYVCAEHLAKRISENRNSRRAALILITDGEDRASSYKKEELFKFLGSMDIQIYTIGFTNQLEGKVRTKAVDLLTLLATETGGRAYFPQSAAELHYISKELANNIRTQYFIGYFPSLSDTNKSSKVEVSIDGSTSQNERIAVTRIDYRVAEN